MSANQRNMEELLQQREALYKSVVDVQSEMIITHLRDSTIVFLNEAFAKFHGIDAQQLIGQKWFSFVPHEVAENTRVLMDSMTVENPISKIEQEDKRYDGVSRWVFYISTGIFDSNGVLTELQVVGRDISERIETERKLKETIEKLTRLEEKFETVTDFTIDMERWVSEDGTILHISPSCKRITGYSSEEFLRTPNLMDKLVLPEDLAIWANRPTKNITSDYPFDMEFRIRRKDGEIRWLNTLSGPVTDKTGLSLGIRSSTRDITDRKQLELELQQANNDLTALKEKYLTIAEFTFNLEQWILADGTLEYISPSCERLTGYTREEFMSDPVLFEKIIRKGDQEIWHTIIADLKPGENIPEVELHIRHKDGQIRWISTSVTSVISLEGKNLGIRTSSQDVTQRKNAEMVLQMAFMEIKEIQEKLEQENMYLRNKVIPLQAANGIQSNAPALAEVVNLISQVAATDSPVLIMGETGTGKELIANAIHLQSKRSGHAMVVVNCSALPPSLIESELFGRERGAYTGALARQIGRFELADKSTLFLDEIGDLPLELQVKLLRVLQFGEFQMLGSPQTKKVDVRIIAATNRNLQEAMENGTFRSDLFFRLNVFPISIPPLRERKEDIPALVWSFIEDKMTSMGKRIDKVSKKSMEQLMKYKWPGNIRELQNIVEYSLILSNSSTLEILMPSVGSEPGKVVSRTLEEAERQHIESILKLTNGRIRGKEGAAEILALNESTLRFKMKKLGIRAVKN